MVNISYANLRSSRADAKAFQILRRQRLDESPTAPAQSLRRSWQTLAALAKRLGRRIQNFVLGTFDGEQLIGMIGITREERLKYRHKANLWGMYVIPKSRNCGVGHALLDAAISKSRAIVGLRQIILTVNSSSRAARSLYASRGFATFGIEKEALCCEDSYFDMEYMRLSLVAGGEVY